MKPATIRTEKGRRAVRIAGTPGGIGAARNPKVFLAPGQVARAVIEKLGQSQNACVKEQA